MAGVALRLEDYGLTDLTVPRVATPTEPIAAAHEAPADRASRLKELDATSLRFKERTAELDARYSAFKQGLARLVRSAEDFIKEGTAVDLDAAIAQFRAMEEVARIDVVPHVTGARSGRALAMRLPLPLRAREVAMYDRFVDTLLRLPEILRDARWEILALRAEAEKQVGQRFDSAGDLARHLETL